MKDTSLNAIIQAAHTKKLYGLLVGVVQVIYDFEHIRLQVQKWYVPPYWKDQEQRKCTVASSFSIGDMAGLVFVTDPG